MKKIVLLVFLGTFLCANAQVERGIRITLAHQGNLGSLPETTDPILTIIQAAPHQSNAFDLQKQLVDKRKFAKINYTNSAYKADGMAGPSPVMSNNFNGNMNNGTPNDNNLAVSNAGQVVSVSNTNIRVYNDTGKSLLNRGLGVMASAQVGALNRSYDPKVIYDPNNDRFILIFLNGTTSDDNDIIVCFTQTNDATGKWNCYRITGNKDNDTTWSDYPVVAINGEDLFVTVNKLKDGEGWKTGFRQSILWQVRLKEGYTGDTLVSNYFNGIKYNGKSIWSICPIQNGMKPIGNSIYLLSVRPGDLQNDTVFIHYIDNSVSSGVAKITTRVTRADKNYGVPPSAIQPPGNQVLETNDTRVLSGFYENGMIQYVQTCVDTNTYNSAIFHGVIQNPSAHAPNNKANIVKNDTLDIAYPSICYTGEGATDNGAIITFSYVNPQVYPGTAAVYVNRDLDGYSDFVYCKQGLGPVDVLQDTAERWGDYTGIQRKYNEKGICWLNGNWADANKQNRTWIARLQSNDAKLAFTRPIENTAITVFPNPATNWVNVDFEIEQNTMLTFSIYTVDGKLVKSLYRDAAKPGLNRFGFDASQFAKGIYLLTITSKKGQVASQKVVVE